MQYVVLAQLTEFNVCGGSNTVVAGAYDGTPLTPSEIVIE